MRSLGIDQSYTQLGISVVEGTSIEDAEIVQVKWYNYKGLKSKSEKRKFIRKLIKHAVKKYEPDVILVERIRTFSQNFISTAYIKTTGALIGAIVDAANPQKVYSIDTRCWKSRVCGSSKGMHKADKGVSVRYIMRRFGETYNDDATDAICIALAGLEYEKLLKSKLLKEED